MKVEDCKIGMKVRCNRPRWYSITNENRVCEIMGIDKEKEIINVQIIYDLLKEEEYHYQDIYEVEPKYFDIYNEIQKKIIEMEW